MPHTLVVVGHGMVGHRLVAELSARDRAGQWRIVVLAEERRPAYDRLALSSYFDGSSAAELALADQAVELRLACAATAIDRHNRTVRAADGATIGYDALVLATGSRPFVPPVPGHDLPCCFTYRTLDDLDAIRAAARPGRPGVVIGGGLLGLEAANALRLLGMRPHVVELAPRLLPLQVDEGAGALLARLVGGLGVRAHCGVATESITPGRVTLADGSALEAELVVFSAGVRPRDELALPAGLDRAERGGILVDDQCRTSDPHIWAIGECAAVNGRCYGLAAPGYRMAETVVSQLLGEEARFAGADMSTKLKLMGVPLASFGDAQAATDGAVEFTHATRDTYRKLVLAPDASTLLGGILTGDTSAYGLLRTLMGRELPSPPEELLGLVG